MNAGGLVGGTIVVVPTGALQNVTGNNTWGGKVILQSNSTINVTPGTQAAVSGVVEDSPPNPVATTTPASLTKIGRRDPCVRRARHLYRQHLH